MNRSEPSRAILITIGLFALLALLFTWQGTLGGKVFAPLELIYHFEPWQALRPEGRPDWDVLLWDGTAQFYVWRDLVRSLWLGGEIPFWTPYSLCGTPLLANSQSAPLYPLHLLALPLPTWLAVGWLAWFHLFWAGLGLALFLRREGLSLPASWMGGALWMFSTFFVAWLQLPSVPSTLSWFGWVLLGLNSLAEGGRRRLALFALPVAMMVLAGHLQFAFYGFLLTALYALRLAAPQLRTDWRTGVQFLGLVLGGLVLGLMIASPQLLPVLEYSGWSHRASVASEEGYQAYVRNALPLFHLVALWFPDAYGHPRNGSYWGAVHYAELALSLGILGLLWALSSLGRARGSVFWWSVVGLSLLLALGTPLLRLFYFYLPGFSATGSPARVLCLFAFGLSVLAGYGFNRFLEVHKVFWRGLGAYIGFGLLAVLIAYTLLPGGVPREPLIQAIGAMFPRVGALLAVSALLGVALQRKLLSAPGALVLLGLMTVLEPFAQGYRYPLYAGREVVGHLSAFTERGLGGEVKLGERIAILNTRWSLYEPPPAVMPSNTSVLNRYYEVGGYDSLLPRPMKQVLDWVNGTDSAPPENGNMQFVKQLNERLRWLRVERALTSDGLQKIEGDQRGIYLGRAELAEAITPEQLDEAWAQGVVLLDAEQGADALQKYGAGTFVSNAQIEWQEYRANSLRLRVLNSSQQVSWLLLSDTYYPGWRAWVDAQPVPLVRANHAFRAVPIPPGTHEVQMSYMPTHFLLGVLASGTAIGVLALVSVRKRRTEKHAQEVVQSARYYPPLL